MTKYLLIAGLAACVCLFITFPVAFSYFSLLNMLILAVLAFTYRPFSKRHEVRCDVIIPAFNEGRHIFETVKSVMESKYKDFKIIVIDDGSSDDTRYWIQLAEKSYPDTVTAVYFDKNRGKKHALAAGIQASDSEIIITIDSDSVIDENAIEIGECQTFVVMVGNNSHLQWPTISSRCRLRDICEICLIGPRGKEFLICDGTFNLLDLLSDLAM
jgi:glycosyltransferase involved in cell wall biosynthesis